MRLLVAWPCDYPPRPQDRRPASEQQIKMLRFLINRLAGNAAHARRMEADLCDVYWLRDFEDLPHPLVTPLAALINNALGATNGWDGTL